MKNLTNATPNTHVYDKFEYFAEDLDCLYCTHFVSNKVAKNNGGRGCGRTVCAFADIKDEATKNNRHKREKGWNKWDKE
ncbi:hypothetical protein FACS18949_01620 [Clostridia bacterium]|nr:hypothetical protein FACS18949_01620 [Clostridia bacterium]